MFGEIDFKKN